MLGWWLQPALTGDYPKVMREFVGERLPIARSWPLIVRSTSSR